VAFLHASPKSPHRPLDASGALVSAQANSLLQQPLQRPHLWGLGLGSLALGLVNGALLLSAGLGWVAYKQLGSLSPRQWATLRRQVERAMPLPQSRRQQALVLSVLLGASTYTMTSLWQATHSPLMAISLLGQTTLTVFIVGVLLRSGRPQPRGGELRTMGGGSSAPGTMAATGQPDPLEQTLEHLSHPAPLQRLVAVRRLVKLVDTAGDGPLYVASAKVSLRSHLLDCFHLMLAHETEPIVRTAVREGLTLLRQTHRLSAGPPPLPSSPAMNQQAIQPSRRQPHRPAVEYVEYIEP